MDKITKEEIQALTPDEKVETLVKLIDTPIGRKKYPQDIILLAQAIKKDMRLTDVP